MQTRDSPELETSKTQIIMGVVQTFVWLCVCEHEYRLCGVDTDTCTCIHASMHAVKPVKIC